MFNDLYRKIILEDSIQEDWEQFGKRYVKKINNDNQFFDTYLVPINKDNKVILSKSMENTFRVEGALQKVLDFLKKFKVDQNFLQNPKDFQVIAPIVVIGNNCFGHKFSFDQGFGPKAAFDPRSTMALDNETRFSLQGRWENLYQKLENMEFETRVKRCTPKDLIKHINHLLQVRNIKDKKDIFICVQFFINCRGIANTNLDENSIITFPTK